MRCEYFEFVKTQLSVCDVQRKLSPHWRELPFSQAPGGGFTCKQLLRQWTEGPDSLEPGLDDICRLLPKPRRRDKGRQYIDWMSKTWKTAFSYTSQPCRRRFLYSTFNSPASPPRLLIPLQISVTEAENTRFSRLDASTDRKNKVNWALRQGGLMRKEWQSVSSIILSILAVHHDTSVTSPWVECRSDDSATRVRQVNQEQ